MGVTSSTIVRWIDRLGFPKPYTLGGRTYFSAKEADEWLEAKKLNRGFNGIPPGQKKS
jgi:predicted DNA-binding transcriptional regulator AlpA